MKYLTVVFLIAIAPAAAHGQITRARFLMGTVCEITANDAGEIDAAFDEAKRVESLLSTWRDDSELSRVNHGEIQPSPELAALLQRIDQLSRDTGGAFNAHIRALLEKRKIREPGPRPAREGEIEEGGFGKGYALDRMLAKLRGDAVINFGGQVIVRGCTKVAIAHPLHRDVAAKELTICNESLSTSSMSEKPGHIVDPRSRDALPARGSVSVIDDSALVADVLSTALYVMGPQEGSRWARQHGVRAIYVKETGEIFE
jgi:thiamine biosynthesis lipoprotein